MATNIFLERPPNTRPVAEVTIQKFFYDLAPLLIKIIAALAILVIAYWGLRYMVSNIPGMKGESKKRIGAAVFGLLLALGTWLILSTINPKINATLKDFLIPKTTPK